MVENLLNSHALTSPCLVSPEEPETISSGRFLQYCVRARVFVLQGLVYFLCSEREAELETAGALAVRDVLFGMQLLLGGGGTGGGWCAGSS